jgi:hypothetical protein
MRLVRRGGNLSQSSTPGTTGLTECCYLLTSPNLQCYHRFRQVPTFGNGVIRKFSNNTSEMKRLAARDFEDILQVLASYLFSRFD